ncbi:MAG TPA: Crp/Fnr family transcriptional regulator [Rubrivivax sp.]|jgi:CRP/FNR family cyclic AMP-dependent transcriptional regulator|nr:Crp/Fnr family transcriptional regulator [Rubrivivax sp.]
MPPSKPFHADPIDHPALSEGQRALSRRGVLRRFARGSVLIQEGDVGDTLYIILSGRLRAFSADTLTEREVTFAEYGPGDFVGELGLDGGPRSASVMALVPATCAVVTRQTLLAFLAERPEFALELLARVIKVARTTTETVRQLALHNVYGRVRQLLESMAQPRPDGQRLIPQRLTHKDIATRCGCTREMVSRVMKELERGGHVAKEGSGLRLSGTLPARW